LGEGGATLRSGAFSFHEETPTPRTRGCWTVQPPQLKLWDLSPLWDSLAAVPDGGQLVFPCPGGLSRGEAPPFHTGAGGSQRPQLALWDMSAPPPLPSLFPPCGTTLPCRPSGQRSFTQAGPIASRVEMKTPSNLSVCRAKLPQSAQVSPQDSGLQLRGRYRCVCARACLRSVVLLSRLFFQG